jgi:hypothetical protein
MTSRPETVPHAPMLEQTSGKHPQAGAPEQPVGRSTHFGGAVTQGRGWHAGPWRLKQESTASLPAGHAPPSGRGVHWGATPPQQGCTQTCVDEQVLVPHIGVDPSARGASFVASWPFGASLTPSLPPPVPSLVSTSRLPLSIGPPGPSTLGGASAPAASSREATSTATSGDPSSFPGPALLLEPQAPTNAHKHPIAAPALPRIDSVRPYASATPPSMSGSLSPCVSRRPPLSRKHFVTPLARATLRNSAKERSTGLPTGHLIEELCTLQT